MSLENQVNLTKRMKGKPSRDMRSRKESQAKERSRNGGRETREGASSGSHRCVTVSNRSEAPIGLFGRDELAGSSKVLYPLVSERVEATGWSRESVGLTRGAVQGSEKSVGRTTQEGNPTTLQSNENCAVPNGRRKAISPREIKHPWLGKAVPVNEQAIQPPLPFETAEDLAQASPDGGFGQSPRLSEPLAEPKSKVKDVVVELVTMEGVVSFLTIAFQSVASNKGASGPDRQSIEEVRKHWHEILPRLTKELLEGTYRPGNIRRVWIPKGGGGQRGLGIPNVVDRVVAEAVRWVLEPMYEPTFHDQSHGFRPGRSCHTAINQAKSIMEEGFEWVVDLDLSIDPRQRMR